MTRANIECVSQGIYEHIPTEDVVGYLTRGDSILAWAIDGASTLTESPFTTYDDLTDAGWFSRAVGGLLETQFHDSPFDLTTFHDGLRRLRGQYLHDANETPSLSAWPVAAAMITEIDQATPGTLQIRSYRYADCFALVSQGMAQQKPHVEFPRPQPPPEYDPWKPFSGFQGETLDNLLQRRCQQQMNEFSTALTLNPVSAWNAIEERLTVRTPAHVLLGSDGLSRIWDTYRIMTSDQAMDFIVQRCLPSLMHVLRTYEASTSSRPDGIKRRDDACGIHISFA